MDGDFVKVTADKNFLSYIRLDSKSSLYCAFNASNEERIMDPPPGYADGTPILDTKLENGKLTMPPLSCAFIINETEIRLSLAY